MFIRNATILNHTPIRGIIMLPSQIHYSKYLSMQIRCHESLRLLNDLLCFIKSFPFIDPSWEFLKKIYIPPSFSWKCMWGKVRMIFSLKHEYKLRFSFLLAILPNLSYQIYECVREILFSFRSVNNRGEGKRQTQNK